MAVIKANVNGNPNVGLFGVVVGDKLLFGEKIRQNKLFEKTLGCELIRMKIAGTDLPGVMTFAHKNKLLIPHIVFEQEKQVLEKHNIDYEVIHTNTTCLGNTIVATKTGAIVSTEFEQEEVEQIQNALGVPCKQRDFLDITTPGAIILVKGDKAIVHKDLNDEDADFIEQTLGVSVEPATVNLGSPYLRAGILLSDKGMIVGDQSGGPEIVNIDNALGFNQVNE